VAKPTSEDIRRADAVAKRKEQERRTATKVAERDAMVKPKDPDVKLRPGEQVPLHVLNIRQREVDRAHNDLNIKAAKAAATAVNETLKRGGAPKKRPTPTKPAGPNTAATTKAS